MKLSRTGRAKPPVSSIYSKLTQPAAGWHFALNGQTLERNQFIQLSGRKAGDPLRINIRRQNGTPRVNSNLLVSAALCHFPIFPPVMTHETSRETVYLNFYGKTGTKPALIFHLLGPRSSDIGAKAAVSCIWLYQPSFHAFPFTPSICYLPILLKSFRTFMEKWGGIPENLPASLATV